MLLFNYYLRKKSNTIYQNDVLFLKVNSKILKMVC
jgi:hypothetical protein